MGEVENLSFEQAFGELEELVRRLEAGDLSLDEAMAVFERGTALAAACNARLDAAELKVRQLVPDAAGGLATRDYTLSSLEEPAAPDDPF